MSLADSLADWEINDVTSETSFAALERADWKGAMDVAGMKASVVDVPSDYRPHGRRSCVQQMITAVYDLPAGKAMRFEPREGQSAQRLRTSIVCSSRDRKVSTAIRDGAVFVWRREK